MTQARQAPVYNGIIEEFEIKGAAVGPLLGLKFAAKDLFDVAGHVSSAGNPDWLKTHDPAVATAPAVQQMLDAGANLVAKTCTDELAFSLDGRNIHYGTPRNPQHPSRIPGGSSSGSASVVASGLTDFALGTDTGGSVRVPASFCGIYGFRPSHGRISTQAVIPLAPSFDTVGWFARDSEMLEKIGSALLKEGSSIRLPGSFLVSRDIFAELSETLAPTLTAFVNKIKPAFGHFEDIELTADRLEEDVRNYMIIQGWQSWQCHGEWISKVKPAFAEDIALRFKFASQVSEEQYKQAMQYRSVFTSQLQALLKNDVVLCQPTTWDLPALRSDGASELLAHRGRNLRFCSLASMAQLPQISIPVRITDKYCSGISFIASAGNDMMLLNLAKVLQELH